MAQILDSKLVGETKNYSVTFQLSVGETISTRVVTASVYSGVDASPSSIISGSASNSGPTVSQKIAAGVLGVVYELLWTITTSAGQTLQQSTYLAISPDLT